MTSNAIQPTSEILLCEKTIASALSDLPIASGFVFDELGSTNEFLLSQEGELNQGYYCLTESQPQGRGRHGKTWSSAPNRNIMLSVSWTYSSWPDDLQALSLAVGLVIAHTLRDLYALETQIKWPNDILIEHKKLAGILVELSGEPNRACQVVAGVGLNCHQSDWPLETDYPWTDLRQEGITYNRNTIAQHLIRNLIILLKSYPERGFSFMVDAWNAASSYTNQTISVSKDKDRWFGRMRGVNRHGALLVEDEDGKIHEINDSTVSIRLVED